jgi:hypothetical protein
MERPKGWVKFVNESERESELDDLRSSAQRGRPFGSEDWMMRIAQQLGFESTLCARVVRNVLEKTPDPFFIFVPHEGFPVQNSG